MRSRSIFVALFVFATHAFADEMGEARAHFKKASAAFAIGEFAEAAEEYQAAYRLKQDPALLYNAAQAFRLAGKNEKALILYKNYLQFYPNEPNIDEVRGQIAKLKEAIAAAEKAKNAPPTGTAEPKTTPADKTPMIEKPATTTSVLTPPPPSQNTALVTTPPKKETVPLYKKWWLWTAVGVVVVGGVVAGAVVATRSNNSWANLPTFGPGSHNALEIH